jgi:hypothetical protein
MKSDKAVTWVLRIVSIVILLSPIVYYYSASASLKDFLIPKLSLPLSDLRFQITSMEIGGFEGNTFTLRTGLLNHGEVGVGLKKLEGEFSIPEFNLDGKIVLQSSLIVPSREMRELVFLVTLENGNSEDLHQIIINRLPIDLSGSATLVLGSAEIPLIFSIKFRTGG